MKGGERVWEERKGKGTSVVNGMKRRRIRLPHPRPLPGGEVLSADAPPYEGEGLLAIPVC